MCKINLENQKHFEEWIQIIAYSRGSSTNKDQYKMYVGDTGLFITLAFWDKDVTENI